MRKIPRCYTCKEKEKLGRKFIEVGSNVYCSRDCIEKIQNKASYPYKLLTNKEYQEFHNKEKIMGVT